MNKIKLLKGRLEINAKGNFIIVSKNINHTIIVNEPSLKYFDGDEDDIGKLVKVNIENSNQNSLFGKIEKKMRAA